MSLSVMTADDIRRTEQDGIAELVGGRQSLLFGHDRQPLRAADAEALEQFVEALPVLRHVDAVCRGAEDADALLVKIVAQLDGSLSAESNDDAVRLLLVDDVLHVLGSERLKVQPVRRVEIGGNSFGVVIDDDDFVAEFFQRPDAMYGGIIELDTLPDADRPRTDDDDALFRAFRNERRRLVVRILVVGRIEIRCFRRKFRRAGIDHLIDRLPVIRDFLPRQLFQLMVGIPEAFALVVQRARQLFAVQAALVLDQIVELGEEPAIDLRDLKNLVDGDARLQRRKYPFLHTCRG